LIILFLLMETVLNWQQDNGRYFDAFITSHVCRICRRSWIRRPQRTRDIIRVENITMLRWLISVGFDHVLVWDILRSMEYISAEMAVGLAPSTEIDYARSSCYGVFASENLPIPKLTDGASELQLLAVFYITIPLKKDLTLLQYIAPLFYTARFAKGEAITEFDKCYIRGSGTILQYITTWCKNYKYNRIRFIQCLSRLRYYIIWHKDNMDEVADVVMQLCKYGVSATLLLYAGMIIQPHISDYMKKIINSPQVL